MKEKKWIQKVLSYDKGVRLLSIGRIVPRDWKYVLIEVKVQSENEIELVLKKVELEG